MTAGSASSSFSAGTIATRRSSASPGRLAADGATTTTSDTRAHRDAEADQIEQPPCAMRVRVLVEHALACAAAELLRLRGIGQQLAVRGDGLVHVADDAQVALGIKPPLDAV